MARNRRVDTNETEGKDKMYWILHSMLTLFIWFCIVYFNNLYSVSYDGFADLFTAEFWDFFFLLFWISVISNVFGRALSFGALYALFWFVMAEEFMKPKEALREPLRKALTITVYAAVSSFQFAIGFFTIILQRFDETTIYTIFVAFLVIKIIATILTWITVKIIFRS